MLLPLVITFKNAVSVMDTVLTSNINKAAYTEKDLAKIVSNINNTEQINSLHSNIRFFAGIGINAYKLKFKGGNQFDNDASSSVFPKINAGFNLNITQSGSFILRTEIYFTGDKANFVYNGQADVPYKQVFKLDHYAASLNPQLLFNVYNTNDFKIFLALGAAVNFSKFSNAENMFTYYFASGSTETTSLPFNNRNAVTANITTKAGVVLKNRLEIYAGYNTQAPITSLEYGSLNLTAFQAGINYIFGR